MDGDLRELEPRVSRCTSGGKDAAPRGGNHQRRCRSTGTGLTDMDRELLAAAFRPGERGDAVTKTSTSAPSPFTIRLIVVLSALLNVALAVVVLHDPVDPTLLKYAGLIASVVIA